MKLCPKCGKQFSDDANFCPVDAARLSPVEAAEPTPADTLAARFELKERVGGTRTGVVYRGVDKQSRATVAVKIVDAAVNQGNDATQRELTQLERLQHAGIANVIGSGKRGAQTWIATELVDGARPLSEVVKSHGPLSMAQAAELVEHIGEALIEAAQVGVVHHDLSPKNVLLAGSDIKLINFSVPVAAAPSTPGVPEFVSPEQVEGKPADQRSNIYSLGMIFYYALTGTTPFHGDVAAVHAGHASGVVTPPSQLVTVIPELDSLIMRALERAPSKRFLTVRQFIDEVVRVSRGGGESLKTTQPMGRAGKPKAELVQTLLGMPGEQLRAAAAAVVSSAAAPAPEAAAATATPTPAAPVVPAAVASAPTVETPMVAREERSPWAAPSGGATATEAAPASSTAGGASEPAVAPAAVAEVAAPQVPAASGGRSKKKSEAQETKGKFRETMWFKKGELDAAAADAAAEERERTGKDADRDKVDSLPIDERYKDDGTISHGDKDKYSLKTGGTQMLPAIRDRSGMSGQVSEDELINEMKSGRGKYLVAILAGVIAIGVLIALVALR
ncbi:MAG: serine/threonine-protein kinase [Kofleriaceae bacterium]